MGVEIYLIKNIYVSLTKLDYQTLRNNAVKKNSQLYPSYHAVQEEKLKCIPEGGIQVGDYNAEVNLQCLLDHTVKRILESDTVDAEQLKDKQDLSLVSKVGFDGCTGQSVYKQLPSEGTEIASIAHEESLFLTCLVPLQIATRDGEVIWTNPKPSSTLYCRPIRFQYTKETRDIVIQESNFIEESKERLIQTKVDRLRITHKLETTMVDGKVATILSEATNATTSCSICGIKCSDMNNLDAVTKAAKSVPIDSFKHGISTLHLWIR